MSRGSPVSPEDPFDEWTRRINRRQPGVSRPGGGRPMPGASAPRLASDLGSLLPPHPFLAGPCRLDPDRLAPAARGPGENRGMQGDTMFRSRSRPFTGQLHLSDDPLDRPYSVSTSVERPDSPRPRLVTRDKLGPFGKDPFATEDDVVGFLNATGLYPEDYRPPHAAQSPTTRRKAGLKPGKSSP